MKKFFLISILLGALPVALMAQDDDLYFVPKKKTAKQTVTTSNSSLPKETYYEGSSRSVDEYNRRGSSYELIESDSTLSDVISFDGVKGVYPDSLLSLAPDAQADEDFTLTRKLQRFDDYDISDNAAFWAGYNAGRDDWGWHSPWYYGRYGYYGWYAPWYYSSWHYGWYDPWYYGWSGYYGWGYPYHWGWAGYYGWGYPYHYYGYYGGGGNRYYARNGNTGTISRYAGRSSSLRNRTVGNHRAASGSGNSSRSRSGNFSGSRRNSSSNYGNSRSTYGNNNSNFGSSRSTGSFSSGGGSFGGGTRSSGGGGGGRSGGSLGGRR